MTPQALDRHWSVNTRATLLLTQAFAAQHDGRGGGRVVWMTSGQGHGPMSDNLAYASTTRPRSCSLRSRGAGPASPRTRHG